MQAELPFDIKERQLKIQDIIDVIPIQFTSICDVTSESICLALRLEIAHPYIHINNHSLPGQQIKKFQSPERKSRIVCKSIAATVCHISPSCKSVSFPQS